MLILLKKKPIYACVVSSKFQPMAYQKLGNKKQKKQKIEQNKCKDHAHLHLTKKILIVLPLLFLLTRRHETPLN